MPATYRVTLTHEDLDGPLVADTMASSPEAAATRVAYLAMHQFRHAELLTADTTVVKLHDGPPRD